MPATVVPIRTRRGQYALLGLALPGAPEHTIGVLLLDSEADRLFLQLRSHFEDLAPPDDLEYLSRLEDDLRARAAAMGAERFLESLEDSLSHVLRISGRKSVDVHSFQHTLERLLAHHVEEPVVVPFRTHLPLYSLRAAATRFGEDMQVAEEDWVRIPEDLRASENLFVAHVVGRSMEPRIPDGSLSVFRMPVVGSRQNKIVLVELLGQLDDSARYTVKKYTSIKVQRGGEEDAGWRHESIRLEPLNPEFQAFELEPDGLRVIAEWVRTLD